MNQETLSHHNEKLSPLSSDFKAKPRKGPIGIKKNERKALTLNDFFKILDEIESFWRFCMKTGAIPVNIPRAINNQPNIVRKSRGNGDREGYAIIIGKLIMTLTNNEKNKPTQA